MPLTKISTHGINDGTIVNADINASAAIVASKLSGVGKVLQVVSTNKTDTFAKLTVPSLGVPMFKVSPRHKIKSITSKEVKAEVNTIVEPDIVYPPTLPDDVGSWIIPFKDTIQLFADCGE